MPKLQERARFHRFGDTVAFHFDDTETLCVTATMARRLAEQFTDYADDVEMCKFTDSPIGTVVVGE